MEWRISFVRGSRSCRRTIGGAAIAAVLEVAALVVAPSVHAELPPLIPREVFFPAPSAMRALQLSPDGRLLSYLAEDGQGTPQIWVRDPYGATPRQLTTTEPPGVLSYGWAENGRFVYYERRHDGGSRHIGVEIASGTERTLVAIDGARVSSIVTRPSAPDELLVSLRLKGAEEDDVYRVNVVTGALGLDTKNPGGVQGHQFHADSALQVRAVLRNTREGGTEVLVRDGPGDPWRPWLSVDSTYSLAVESFSGDGKSLLLRTDLASDMDRLIERTIEGGRERVIAASTELDVEQVLLHPRTREVQAVSFLTDPRRWKAIEPSIAADLRAIRRVGSGQLYIGSRDRADSRWLVWIGDDHSSPRCLLWDRATRKASLVFEEQPQLARLSLARVKPVSIRARDGLRIGGYLTLPVGVPSRRLPLVVWVHGGPYLRDAWGYDNIGQLFANRGYAFLRVNYRGSRGFGRRFRLASFKQWGRTMQDDVLDAVDWAVRSGIADGTRMAIMGHSYGGYVALAALTLTPDLFACGAASSTTANLVAFVSKFPKTPGNAWVRNTIGDPDDPKEAAALRSVSPFFHVDRISKPVLVARGDNDGALPPGDLDAFIAGVEKRGVEAVSVVYEGDGHFFRRENQLDYFARVEALLARHLGGRAESAARDRQPGSTGRVRVNGM